MCSNTRKPYFPTPRPAHEKSLGSRLRQRPPAHRGRCRARRRGSFGERGRRKHPWIRKTFDKLNDFPESGKETFGRGDSGESHLHELGESLKISGKIRVSWEIKVNQPLLNGAIFWSDSRASLLLHLELICIRAAVPINIRGHRCPTHISCDLDITNQIPKITKVSPYYKLNISSPSLGLRPRVSEGARHVARACMACTLLQKELGDFEFLLVEFYVIK